MTREYTDEEVEYITEASERFYKEGGFDLIEYPKEYYKSVLDNPVVFAEVIVGKGFIVGMIAPSFLHPGRLQCSELAWYVEPEYRGTTAALRLMRRYEKVARDNKCYYVSMVAIESLNPKATGKIYEKLGYTKLENHYRRIL